MKTTRKQRDMIGNFTGKLVRIHEDPITCEIYDGMAKIVKMVDAYDFGLERIYEADVRFLNEELVVRRQFTKRDVLLRKSQHCPKWCDGVGCTEYAEVRNIEGRQYLVWISGCKSLQRLNKHVVQSVLFLKNIGGN
jgi:hypothetical protein